MPSSYTLDAHYETLVENLVSSGRFASASDVMREGLRLLEDREVKRQALIQAIQEGLDSGPAELWDAEEVKREGRRRLEEQRRSSSNG